jgi:hypothetical protein
MKVISAFARAALLDALGVWALVLIQRGLGWTPISSDPSSVSSYLTSLAQFAAIPVTLALGILVLVIQLQAGTLTSRAGAVVVNSPEFLFTVALLFSAPAFCILLLGIFERGQGQVSVFERELAFAALVPVLLTLEALIRFTNMWFRLVSPAAFTGLVFEQVVQGFQEKNRDTAALAVRGLGEAATSLCASTDYVGVRLCANQIGMLLERYVEVFKPQIPKDDEFFYYKWPERKHNPNWLEEEACGSMRDAADMLMLRGGPEETILYMAKRLTPFGQKAIDVGDVGAVKVLAETLAGMGTTEKTFMVARNLNSAPWYEAANLVLENAGKADKAEAVNLLAAAFFLMFTYVYHHTERGYFTSTEHVMLARQLKGKGINFAEVAKLSREKLGVWNARFADPDQEAQKALRKIRSL